MQISTSALLTVITITVNLFLKFIYFLKFSWAIKMSNIIQEIIKWYLLNSSDDGSTIYY